MKDHTMLFDEYANDMYAQFVLTKKSEKTKLKDFDEIAKKAIKKPAVF